MNTSTTPVHSLPAWHIDPGRAGTNQILGGSHSQPPLAGWGREGQDLLRLWVGPTLHEPRYPGQGSGVFVFLEGDIDQQILTLFRT